MKTRKIVSLLALCTLVLSLFAVIPASAATNYLTDCIGFEGESYTSASTFDGWNINSTNSSKLSAEVTEKKAYSGSKSLEVTVLDETGGQINYTGSQTLVAGTEYKVSMMVSIPVAMGDGASTGGIQIRTDYVEGGSGSTESKYFGGPAYYNTGDAWQEISGTFVATENTTVAFRFRSGAPVNSIFYVDDIAVYSTEELQAEAEAEAAERAAKNFSYVSEYKKVYDEELCLNMDSDSDVTATGATIAVDTDTKHQGTGSVKTILNADAADYTELMKAKNLPTFLKDMEYEASIWAYVPSDSEISHLRFMVQLTNGNSVTYLKYVQKKILTDGVKGQWLRISIPFTMTDNDTAKSITLQVKGKKDDVMYWDDLTIVRKQSQNAVLQITKAVTLDSIGAPEADVVTPGAGAFTVKYDFHKASATNAGKVLIAGIYKDTGAGKQLMEIKMVTATAEATSVSTTMDGVANPDESYSLKVMYWDSLAGMFGYRTAEFAF